MDKRAIQVIAENLVVKNITNEAVDTLINDAELKIRLIVSMAITYMKRSHRKVLECKDIKRAMKTLNLEVIPTQNIYGFPASQVLKYRRIAGDEDSWYLEDSEVTITEFLSSKVPVPDNYSLHTHWLAIEGKVPNIPENEGEDVEDVVYEKVVESEAEIHHQLSLEQQKYYNFVLTSLNSGERLEEVLNSLNTDSSLSRLIPYITRSMFTMLLEAEDLPVLFRGVKILGALSTNKFLNLEPYLHQIMPALLSALMRADLYESGQWQFRKNTAGIIAKVCDHFADYYEDLKSRVLKLYVKVLEDKTKSPASHYSAIQGINAFGVLCIKNLLVPLLPMYLNSILAEGMLTAEVEMWAMCKTALIVSFKQEGCRMLLKEDPTVYKDLRRCFAEEFLEL